MSRWFNAFILGACLAAPSAAASQYGIVHGRDTDVLSLYGSGIDFDVYRHGEKVGHHKVRFNYRGSDLMVSSQFSLEIRVLFFSAYNYLYQSESLWRQGEMHSLTATVDDDGTVVTASAARDGDRYRITSPDGTATAIAPVYPTNHWHVGVLEQDRVLNTLTGRINDVRIAESGRGTVPTERGEVMATRYAYSGDFDAEVWYDDAGRWVKMRFDGRDGSTIDYICRRCQGRPVDQAAQ